jgi:hypothetical protein
VLAVANDLLFRASLYDATVWIQGVGIAAGHELDDRGVGVRVPIRSRIFSSPSRPDRIWGPYNLLFHGYRGSFSGDKAAGA